MIIILFVSVNILHFSASVSLYQDAELIEQESTTNDINLPRCGLVEEIDNNKMYAKFVSRSKWSHKNITYWIQNYAENISRNQVDEDIKNAFSVWSAHVDLIFTRTVGKANIEIKFCHENHAEHQPFDGDSGILAFAGYPEKAFIHFNSAENWALNTGNVTKLFRVAVHEIGHTIGLLHSNQYDSVMYKYYFEGIPIIKLNKRDIDDIRYLYSVPRAKPGIPLPTSVCEKRKIDTIFRHTDGRIYIFQGEWSWIWMQFKSHLAYPEKISNRWSNLPRDIDAAYTNEGYTYFFKGSEFWRYNGSETTEEYPQKINKYYPGIPDYIDTAVVWLEERDVLFFKGDSYWIFDIARRNSQGPFIRNEYFSHLNGFIIMDYSDLFIFKDEGYYRINSALFDVALGDPPYPRDIGDWWFGCQNNSRDD